MTVTAGEPSESSSERTVRLGSTDRWANGCSGWGWRSAALLLLAIGRKQWFIQDDWSLLITRETAAQRPHDGLYWLNFPQDGHWLAVPALIWYVTMSWFGLDSYLPFLVPMIATYLGCVVLLRVLCRRVGITAWTTTIVCVMLAMFGSGWENLVWAVQLCYFLSLLAFLAHLLLVDHEGRLDWRDGLAALIAIIGVASSGFGPFFLFGAAVMIVLRRRWWALLTVVPAGLAWLWWFVVYSSDEASQRNPGSRARVPEFAINGLLGTFDALVGALPVTGLAILGCIGVLAWKRDQLGAVGGGVRVRGDGDRDVPRDRLRAASGSASRPPARRATSASPPCCWRRSSPSPSTSSGASATRR